MPSLSESLVSLEQRLADALLDFERLDAAWPRGRTALERAEIGRRREEALSEIMVLLNRCRSALCSWTKASATPFSSTSCVDPGTVAAVHT